MTIRSKFKIFMLIAAALSIGIASAAVAKPVPSHQLSGTFSVGTVGADCSNAGGTFFNSPNGGYGCATEKGTVTCTSKGTCTGTCSNCQQVRGKTPIGHPLPVGNTKQALSANSPGVKNHPIIAGGARVPGSTGSLRPPSGGKIIAYARAGFSKR